MHTLRHLLIWTLSLLAIFLLHTEGVSAGCNGWFSFGNSCSTTPVYCGNGECTIEKGNEIVSPILPGISNKPLSQYAQDIVVYFMGFVSIIAVIWIIYAGFQVMVGGGDEEKMKKAKNTILYVVIGIVIMWLAYSIVRWTTDLVTKTAYTEGRRSIASFIIPEAQADASIGTFAEYRNKLRISVQELEKEYRINGSVSNGTLQNIKNLVQSAYDRLPDSGDAGTANDTAKRAIDMYIELALKSPNSSNHISNVASKIGSFIEGASIGIITGDISANPTEGNAPMIVSFRASNIKDPSGATPDNQNYIWWVKTNGGKRELGRGPSLIAPFNQEGTFTVFLEVSSSSRNSKGYTDVLPLSISKSIEVKPKLGEVVLMVNGVNVSNIPSLKISPILAKMGIIFDATASRAIGNGSISNTNWVFGNENSISYKGSPNTIERQIYSNQGTYNIKLELTSNEGVKFVKDFQLIVRDPAAVISFENEIVHIGEEVHMTSTSYFANNNNIEYSWQIQDDNNQKIVKSVAGNKLNFTFSKIGKYIVTLTARSPNGGIDTDSRIVNVESREPMINLEMPQSISTEKPNVFVFNAQKSYDPDTNSKKGLTYIWKLNGENISLDNVTENGAKGTYEFTNIGTNTISITVSNQYGKVSTQQQTFEVTSLLSANLIITPQMAPIGTQINFIAQSDSAEFYEWNFGDGSANINGTKKVMQHTFDKTGVYDVTLTIRGNDGNLSNQIRRKVYVTDSKNPMAIVDIKNSSSTIYEDPQICESGAYVLNRSEPTTIDGSKSVNVDGTTSDLSYTWKYFGKVKTTSSLNEKFSDLGCFPIELTVRNNKNGTTNTKKQYIYLKNQSPEITSVTTNIDSTKKDSQKVLVKVTANGAVDPDGVITSYIWYYTTGSDKEPQNVQITQKNEITFVLPNITEKYYFGVILEDNDGARINSMNEGSEQAPLILDNQNGNIYMPLISLSAPKTAVAVGEKVQLGVTAKTIVGTDITKQADYAWDFDGDGKIDERATQPFIYHTYDRSGTYTVKVRATYNGVSNTKYQTIYVKNPLKAGVQGYKNTDGDIYLINTSSGNYNQVTWNIGGLSSNNLYGILVPKADIGTGAILGQLTIANTENDVNTVQILGQSIESINMSSGSSNHLQYQTFPSTVDNTLSINQQSDRVIVSFFGNRGGTRYEIDQNTDIDSDLDGISDNDVDNKDSPSYIDGSAYAITDFSVNENPIRTIKITGFAGNTPIGSKALSIKLNYIKTVSTVSGEGIMVNSGSLSTFDRTQLDTLADLIRSVDDTNRIILMKTYNTLIENWDDSFSKAKILIDLQESVNTLDISQDQKTKFSQTIDALLMGDAQSTDEVTLAAKLIEGLIPPDSANRTMILKNLEAIQSHPQLLDTNKALAKEILEAIKDDSTLEDKYKIHIRNQLLVILNGGQSSVPAKAVDTPVTGRGSGILAFIKGFLAITGILIMILIGIILIGFIAFRLTRKDNDQGFQDFLIDRVFHRENQAHNQPKDIPKEKNTSNDISEVIIPATQKIIEDPLKSYTVQDPIPGNTSQAPSSTVEPIQSNDPLSETNASVPDWFKAATKPQTIESTIASNDPLSIESSVNNEVGESQIENVSQEDMSIPETSGIQEHETTSSPLEKASTGESTENIPDWLKSTGDSPESVSDTPVFTEEEVQQTRETNTLGESIRVENSENTTVNEGAIPDWLVDAVQQQESYHPGLESPNIDTPIELGKKATTPKTKKKGEKTSKTESSSTDANTPPGNESDIPDWLK